MGLANVDLNCWCPPGNDNNRIVSAWWCIYTFSSMMLDVPRVPHSEHCIKSYVCDSVLKMVARWCRLKRSVIYFALTIVNKVCWEFKQTPSMSSPSFMQELLTFPSLQDVLNALSFNNVASSRSSGIMTKKLSTSTIISSFDNFTPFCNKTPFIKISLFKQNLEQIYLQY